MRGKIQADVRARYKETPRLEKVSQMQGCALAWSSRGAACVQLRDGQIVLFLCVGWCEKG